MCVMCTTSFISFFFNDTATTEIYTLSLHDALPISPDGVISREDVAATAEIRHRLVRLQSTFIRLTDINSRLMRVAGACNRTDRKSTRLNSSHSQISYAVFCLKKKKVDGNSHAPNSY